MLNYHRHSGSNSLFMMGCRCHGLMRGSSNGKALFILISVLLSMLILTGCGQSGSLYLPKDAPSNTDFIIYKGNKTEATDAKQASRMPEVETTDNTEFSEDY